MLHQSEDSKGYIGTIKLDHTHPFNPFFLYDSQ